MAKAYQVIFNGHGETVVRDADAALMHVANNLLDGRSDPDRLAKAIASEAADWDFLKAAGATPHLAALLNRAATAASRESVAIVEHEMSAPAGTSTVRLRHDLASDKDPSYALLTAFENVANGMSPDEAEEALREEVIAAVGAVGGFGAQPDDVLDELRARAATFGPPSDSPLCIIPEQYDDENPEGILDGLAEAAADRFRDIVSRLDLGNDAPAP